MRPLYLELSENEFREKIEKLYSLSEPCRLCPKACRVDRSKILGDCRVGSKPMVSAFHLHFGEEKVLVGRGGSGTIFFTGCNLRCVYCQNYEISQLMWGREVEIEDLATMMIKLQDMGAENINLVTPTHQVHQVHFIFHALFLARERGLRIPIVYNTSGYESVATLKVLEGLVDVYMPDFKYSSSEMAERYSDAPGYFEVVKIALKEMHRQVGDLMLENGVARRGLLVRHLVLPNGIAGSEEVLKFLAEEISRNTFVNVMGQYYPAFRAFEFGELSRRITRREYEEAVRLAEKLDLRVYKE